MGTTLSSKWDENRLSWLGLAWFDGFGARTLKRLRARFKNDGSKAFHAQLEEFLHLGVTEKTARRFIAWRNAIDPAVFVRRCDTECIRFILDDDSEFPSYLKHSNDPPAVLFLRGAELQPHRPIAIVGTRAMTHYGQRVTEQLGHELAISGCEIISGLALGIDSEAHKAALDVHGTTIAVLPGGINDDTLYPRQHAGLAKRIIESNGTLLSECPPGTENFKHLFLLRNRLIAALCVATIVVEAAESSGSLITAKLAIEDNRDVFAVPGPITSEQSNGTNRLLKEGASPCLGAEDILALFQATQPTLIPIELTTQDRKVLELLQHPLHLDELIRELLPSSPSSVIAQCSRLELEGLIDDQGGGFIARTKLGKRSLD